MFKTYALKHKEIQKNWFVIDAKDVVLGRLASQIARILMGKHKPSYSPHLDCGDNVVVINAKEVKLTGSKLDSNEGKKYYRHTGHPGGIKEISALRLKESAKAPQLVINAVRRMLTRNNLGRERMTNLYVYAGEEHRHEAQKPTALDMQSLNPKNKR